MKNMVISQGLGSLKEDRSLMSYLPASVNYYYSDLKGHLDKLQNYKRVRKEFRHKMQYELNLETPRTLNEKLAWKKLFDRNPLLTLSADKYAVRSYLKNLLGETEATKHLIPLYFVTEKPSKIPFEDLPDKYVIKPNHGSRMHLIVKNKKYVVPKQIIKQCNIWLKNNYGFYTNEWAYKNIKRKILIEKLFQSKNGELPMDYKFFCFHGEVKIIRAALNRFSEISLSGFYDPDWNPVPVYNPGYQNTTATIDKPSNLNAMVTLAGKISKDFDFVRVDLYSCDESVFFGELTHYPGSGLIRFEPESFDYRLGEYWNLKPDYWR